MTLTFLLSFLLYFNSIEPSADSALQEVLNIDEVKSYFTKAPRFTTSQEKSIVLFNSADITLHDGAKINRRSIQIINASNMEDNDLIVFIKLNELTINKHNADINLTIQNAILLLEDKQQVQVVAKLTKKGDSWEVKNYELKRVNISY